MRLTKEQVLTYFNDALTLFESEIQEIPNGVVLHWMDFETFKDGLLENPIYKKLNEKGLFDFETRFDFPSFAVVFPSNKHRLRALMGIPFQINVCWEYLEGTLARMNSKQGRFYLKAVFLHELVHLVEDDLICQNNDLWEECLIEARGSESLAKEVLAERLPEFLLGDKAMKATDEAWKPVHRAIQTFQLNQKRA